jgi:hypothetical protein
MIQSLDLLEYEPQDMIGIEIRGQPGKQVRREPVRCSVSGTIREAASTGVAAEESDVRLTYSM